MRLLNPMISALPVAEAHKPLAPDEREELRAWLKATVDASEHGMRHEGQYEGRRHGITDGAWVRKAAHNHSVQSSLAAMSFGAWAGNDEYFKVGIDQWFITLESARKDGSLPIETRRGAAGALLPGQDHHRPGPDCGAGPRAGDGPLLAGARPRADDPPRGQVHARRDGGSNAGRGIRLGEPLTEVGAKVQGLQGAVAERGELHVEFRGAVHAAVPAPCEHEPDEERAAEWADGHADECRLEGRVFLRIGSGWMRSASIRPHLDGAGRINGVENRSKDQACDGSTNKYGRPRSIPSCRCGTCCTSRILWNNFCRIHQNTRCTPAMEARLDEELNDSKSLD